MGGRLGGIGGWNRRVWTRWVGQRVKRRDWNGIG